MDRHEARKRESALNAQFQQLERQSRQIESQKTRNAQQTKRISQAEKIFTDTQLKKRNQLETLSHNWKGKRAEAILSESLSNHEVFYRQQMRQIHEHQQKLTQEKRALLQQEEKLMQAKRQLVRGGR